jgi:apolipoprotein N-acyltransferase
MLSPAVRRWLRWEERAGTDAKPKRAETAVAVTMGVALLVLGTFFYGHYRLRHEPFAEGPIVSAIQGNMSQGDKMTDQALLVKSYSTLHLQAFHSRPQPDLIIWPETCCPIDWCEIAPGARADGMPGDFGRKWAAAQEEFLGRGWGTHVLFGLNGLEWDGTRAWKYNSAFLVKPLPKPEGWVPGDPIIHQSAAAGRYDKMHLVPFGEYVPLGEQLPFMKWFTPYKHDYSCRPGEKWTRFQLKTKDSRPFTFGCLICYEDSDTYLARQYVASEPVNFLVNISNDGWFDGTEEHEQHLAICRFRAIEARRSVVRSVNMGISAVIDPDGRVVALPNPDWGKSKKVEAVVTAAVPIDSRESLYATLGDWVPAVCWLAALVAVVLSSVFVASGGREPPVEPQSTRGA